jgi:hypothetical protein
MWIKRSSGAGGALGIAYWINDADTAYIGPFSSHITVMYGAEEANPSVALSDSLNVDGSCVKEANGTVIGCAGNFDTYKFGEARAVAGCNGAASDVTRWECETDSTSPSGYGNGSYRSGTATPFTDGGWHFIEGFFAMSSIANGIGQPDGVVRYWVDGQPVLASDHMLLRTGAQPQLAWNQLVLAPFLEVTGAAQELWLDELTIAIGVR